MISSNIIVVRHFVTWDILHGLIYIDASVKLFVIRSRNTRLVFISIASSILRRVMLYTIQFERTTIYNISIDPSIYLPPSHLTDPSFCPCLYVCPSVRLSVRQDSVVASRRDWRENRRCIDVDPSVGSFVHRRRSSASYTSSVPLFLIVSCWSPYLYCVTDSQPSPARSRLCTPRLDQPFLPPPPSSLLLIWRRTI